MSGQKIIDDMLAALVALSDAAERDMKLNQGSDDEDDFSGGHWSLATETAIHHARAAIAKATKGAP